MPRSDGSASENEEPASAVRADQPAGQVVVEPLLAASSPAAWSRSRATAPGRAARAPRARGAAARARVASTAWARSAASAHSSRHASYDVDGGDERRVGRLGARQQLEVEAEVGHHRRGERGELGVPRDPGGVARRTGRRPTRGAADVAQPLEHEHRQSGTPEIGRGHQAVVATSGHDDVICCAGRAHAHQPNQPPLQPPPRLSGACPRESDWTPPASPGPRCCCSR